MSLLKYTLSIFSLFVISIGTAQNFSAKVIDQVSGEPIPYATIETGINQGIITNEEGEFTFLMGQVKRPQDSIYISYMGYETKGVLFESQENLEIQLTPKIF